MLRYSTIIPQRDEADKVRRQLSALVQTLDGLGEPYEIIVVDDGSAAANLRLIEKLLSDYSSLRLLRLDEPRGVSVALNAAVRAARGEVLIAIEPGDSYPPSQILPLIEGLQRADFMAGRRRQVGIAKAWHRISRLPRWLLLGLAGHDPDCLFWAARREVFADFQLSPGMARYLPALVTLHDFRACEIYVEHHGARWPLNDVPANPGDLLAAWWHCRRWRNCSPYELTANRSAQPKLRIVGTPSTAPFHGATESGANDRDKINYPSPAKLA
jgi:glycosyltransferase involved in cell wall biosynthesis